MSSETIYHENYFLSIYAGEHLSVILGLPTVLYPIEPFGFIADFRLMLQSDPTENEWNNEYSYTYRYHDEATDEEKYGLRSISNPTVIALTKSQWLKVAALFEKAWPRIEKAFCADSQS